MARSDPVKQLDIVLPHRTYPVFIGQRILNDSCLLARYINGKQALLVSNDTIAPLYLAEVKDALPVSCPQTLILPDGENYKTLETLSRIYNSLVQGRHHRDTTIIALGGGVIGDICGLAAATFQRGVNFIQLPTTLLAQVDASVGGKTAVNHPGGKNMIGCFYQPNAVLIDTNTLQTLPQRELRAGMAEVIKYAFLQGNPIWKNVADFIAQDGLNTFTDIDLLIKNCCEIKAAFVMEDEKESGRRALLNFGHTFAHALESVTHYERWLHGEAVAIGMVCALILSYHKGYCSYELLTGLIEWLRACSLPFAIPADISLTEIMDKMWSDKKIINGNLRFIVCRSPGDCFITADITAEDIKTVLNNALEKCDGQHYK